MDGARFRWMVAVGGPVGSLCTPSQPSQPASRAAVGPACLSLSLSDLLSGESSFVARPRCSPPLPTDPFRRSLGTPSGIVGKRGHRRVPIESSSWSTLSRYAFFLIRVTVWLLYPLYYPSSTRINRVQYFRSFIRDIIMFNSDHFLQSLKNFVGDKLNQTKMLFWGHEYPKNESYKKVEERKLDA